MVHFDVLLATAMLDTIAPVQNQYTLYNRLSRNKQHILFGKHEHELINQVEDEHLKFIRL